MRERASLYAMTNNETNNTKDVRFTHIQFIYNIVRGYANLKKEPLKKLGVEPDDFTQTFMLKIFIHRGFDTFQIEWGIARLEALVRSCCYRLLMQFYRNANCKFRSEIADGTKVEVVSLDSTVEVGEGTVLSLADIIPDNTSDSIGTEYQLEKLHTALRTHGMAYRSYSWEDLLNIFSENELLKNVAQILGCNLNCASYLKMRLMGLCKEIMYS